MVNKKPIRGIITDQTCFKCDRIIKKGEYAYLKDGEFRHIGCQEVSKNDFKKRYPVNKPGKKKAEKILKETKTKIQKRRTKKDPLSIEAPFIRIKEIRVKGRLKLASASDKVLMKTSPAMWNDFHNAFLQDQKQFAREIYYNFIEPAIKKINHAPERGMQKNRTQLINKIMLDSAWLYCFVKYWNKCPDKRHYNFKRALIKLKQNEHYKKFAKHFSNSKAITMFLIEKAYKTEMQEHKIKSWSNHEIFHRTYLVSSKNPFLKDTEKRFKTHVENNTVIIAFHNISNILLKCL